MNIYEKLVEVRKTVEYLQKEAKGAQYSYVSSSQVLGSLRAKMNELGLLLIPRVTGHNLLESTVEQKNKETGDVFKRTTTYFTELDMIMTWVNAEKPAETIECPWYGQGVDIAGEKGVGKALTYAEKYFLLKQFNIPTDKDDPDSFQEKHDPKPQPSPNAKPQDKPPANPPNGDDEFTKIVDGQTNLNYDKAPEVDPGNETLLDNVTRQKLLNLQTKLGMKATDFVSTINGWIAKAAPKGGFEPFEIAALNDLSKVDKTIVTKLIETLDKKALKMGAK